MSRIASTLAALFALAAPADAAPRAASVTLERCTTGATAAERSATFVARMRALPGAERLQLRFWLQVREEDGASWQPVEGEGLGTWHVSEPGVRGYVFAKRVEHLPPATAARTQVDFRWVDAAGAVLRRARRVSEPCRQADPAPAPGATLNGRS